VSLLENLILPLEKVVGHLMDEKTVASPTDDILSLFLGHGQASKML